MAKKSINIEVGERIRERRERNAWSRDYLAEATGYSVRYLGMVETGVAGVSLEGLRLFSEKLGVSTDYLLNGYSDPFFRNITVKLSELYALSPQHLEHAELQLAAYIAGVKLSASAGK